MTDNIRTRLRSEQGFTLIELLVVMIILSILIAIAVPAYLSFTGKANVAAAKANVRSAIPAAESYYQDAAAGNDSYTGMTGAKLVLEAPGVSPNVTAVALNGGLGYCVQDTENAGATIYSYIGGTATPTSPFLAATIQSGTCAADAGGTAT